MSFGQTVRSNILNNLPRSFTQLPGVYGLQRQKVEGDRLTFFVVSVIVVLGAIVSVISAYALGLSGLFTSVAPLYGALSGISLGLFACLGSITFLSRLALSRINSFRNVNSFLRKHRCKFSHIDDQQRAFLSLLSPTNYDYVLTQKKAWTHPLFPCRVILSAGSVILGVGLLTAGVYVLSAYPGNFLSHPLASISFSFLSSSLVFSGLSAFKTHFLLAEGVSSLQLLYLSQYLLPKSTKNIHKERDEELNALRLQLSKESLSKEKFLRKKNLAEFRLKKVEEELQECMQKALFEEEKQQSSKTSISVQTSEESEVSDESEQEDSEFFESLSLISTDSEEEIETNPLSLKMLSKANSEKSSNRKVFSTSKIVSRVGSSILSSESKRLFQPGNRLILTGLGALFVGVQGICYGAEVIQLKVSSLKCSSKVQEAGSWIQKNSKIITGVVLEILEEEKKNKEASFSWLLFRFFGIKVLKKSS
ncbi:hypothetical protein [Chlamydiifrater volucris]|uniref:hypothetical protein n=1 Tax=Chlamydiifrater volucris TaxID=2681470 RepID=UPI001BD15CFA|nr:hypothetical protein [Chlamydiifrater volucris]